MERKSLNQQIPAVRQDELTCDNLQTYLSHIFFEEVRDVAILAKKETSIYDAELNLDEISQPIGYVEYFNATKWQKAI